MTRSAVLVEDLSYTFAGRSEPTLAGIGFALDASTWTVVAGRTGSGKSTLLRALAGLIPHHTAGTMQGRVELFGLDTARAAGSELARTVGLVLQSPDDQICATTVEAEVAFGLENLATPTGEIGARVASALERVGLREHAARRTAELSGGQKQRLLLASIVAMGPRLLVLDEPLSQLDPAAAAELLETLDRLRHEGLTLVVVEHRLDDVIPYADRVLLVDDGRLAADVDLNRGDDLLSAMDRLDLDPPELKQLATRLGQAGCRTPTDFIEALDRLPSPLAGEGLGVRGSARVESNVAPPPHPSPLPPGEREPTLARLDSIGMVESNIDKLLVASGLAFRFHRRAPHVWESIEFAINAGERVALVGPNGSGKSTLLAVIAGLLRAVAGELRRPASCDGRAAIALVLQNPDLMLFCRTVREELAFGPRQLGLERTEVEQRVDAAVEALDLIGMLDQPPMALSQGERLRTAVAATLTLAPRLLLLDEPTTGQDLRQVERVMRAIDAQMRDETAVGAVLFATHDVRTVVRFASRVLVLAGGRLIADCTPEQLLVDDALLAAARLRRTPLLEVRQRLGLTGWTVDELAEELRR